MGDWDQHVHTTVYIKWASQVAIVVKNLTTKSGDIRDTGSIFGSGRSPGGGHSNLLQYACLENLMDRGDCRLQSMGVTESDTTEVTDHVHTDLFN